MDDISMMQKFLEVQIHKLDIDKWCEGYKLNNDPGDGYLINWINKNAEWFRNAWNESSCKKCVKYKNCGYEVKQFCNQLIEEN